jgi:hypothetical protein
MYKICIVFDCNTKKKVFDNIPESDLIGRMPIPTYNFPSEYDLRGSKRYDCDTNYEYDDQEWVENALYKRRHDGLYNGDQEEQE